MVQTNIEHSKGSSRNRF